MADKNKFPQGDFSIDEILAEAHTIKKGEPQEAAAEIKVVPENKNSTGIKKEVSAPDEIAEQARRALENQAPPAPPAYTAQPEKKKKKPFSLFNRRKRKFAELEEEEDIYYGLQLKTLEDYRDAYEKTLMRSGTTKKQEGDSVFSYLFQDSDDNSIDNEIAEQFEHMHRDRRNRVERAIHQAGVEHDDIFSLYDTALESTPEPLPEEPPEEPVHPTIIPGPEPTPEPARPTPKPEIQPAPLSEPEIPESSPSQPASPAPGASPQIRCRDSEEPVKEPVPVPQVKEEVPLPAQRREPPVKPAPRMISGYRALTCAPMHMVEAGGLSEVLSAEAVFYPEAVPEPPPEPIPLPSMPHPESTEFKPPIIVEHTLEFKLPVKKPVSDEPAPAQEAAAQEDLESEPIPFPDSDVLEAQEEEIPEEAPKKKNGFHVFGNEEEDNDSADALPQEQEELDDYSIPSDAPSISHDLGTDLRKMYLRLAVTGISTTLLFLNGFIGEMQGLLPRQIQIFYGIQPYLILNLIFSVIAFAFCATAIFNGIKGMFTLQANSDSAIAVAAVAALIQDCALFFSQENVKNGSLHLYSALVVMALFLNTGGKVSLLKRINKNFAYVAAPDQKQSIQIFDDHNTSLQMAKGCVMDAPVIAFQKKTNFLKHFLRLSYEPDPSEQHSQTLAPILFVLSLVLCMVTLYLTKNMYRALSAFAAATCISVPFANMLCVNLPLGRLSKIASRCGAMIVGYPSVEQFSNTNAVMVDAKDLFPKGTVILNGIKTFAGQRIDEAIVDATALMCSVGGPLSDLFDQIIKSRRDMLPKIENPVYEDNQGIIGWVSGRRILVGNRQLMESHGIEPPSHDYEEKYITSGKQIIYLASGGDLVAMFVVSYNSDRRRALELRRMEDNGISLIVRTCDPNITPELLAQCFGLDAHCINVLPQRLGKIYTELTAEPQERSTALLSTRGRPTAMMRMLTACVRQRSNISIALALQMVAVILGFVLVAFLTCYSGLQQLSTSALLIYQAFWLWAILFVPRIRKP